MQANLPAPWEHQKQIVQRSLTESELALLWEVGTGKTRATIDILRYRCAQHDRLLRTLILCPKIVILNWFREIQKYSRIHPRDVVMLTGPGKKRAKTIIDQCTDNHLLTKGKVLICNYETMEMSEVHKLIQDWNPEVVIADEAHRLKNHESKRAKKVIEISDRATYRYALTGTLILDGKGMDIFNIYRFLDKGETFGVSFWKFRATWFEDENAGFSSRPGYFPSWVPKPEAFAEFSELIYKKAMRAVKSECLDLPPFVRKQVFVEMSSEQKRLYNEMKDEYVAYIDDITKTDTPRAVVAQMAITKALRLQQIVTGYAKTEDGEIYKIEANPRLDALKDLLEDLTPKHKVIVWSVFHENYADIAQVCKELKIDYTELHGQVSEKNRNPNIDKFNNDPKCRVLIGNQGAGGIGVNLISSSVSVYYSKNFSLEHDIQSEGRNYRGGSEMHESVTRIDIVCPGTIDEMITEALSLKQEVADKILDWQPQTIKGNT